jgi:hypothetical protein
MYCMYYTVYVQIFINVLSFSSLYMWFYFENYLQGAQIVIVTFENGILKLCITHII